ncbi:MAG: 16S rRNA (cytidine(1402)-2'-O)-methyltransferase [Bacteroidia bacterium]|nr:16S rRNA (cytidine(1402)-2'-O)-methyltransferase [Bacteroidia bacterium]
MAKLYLVPTPIGNLEDITFRALRILREATLIAAEDTRQTVKLLQHYEIKVPMTSLHAHNEHTKAAFLVEQVIAEDKILAVVSDAGMPGISDPGYMVVQAALAAGLEFEVLPGPAAFLPALVGSGLPCDKFVFEGFLPQKKGRQTRLRFLQDETRTVIFYESPHRILKTLAEFVTYYGPERKVVVARELTKIHEEFVRGTLQEVIRHFENGTVKGEMVIILAGKE